MVKKYLTAALVGALICNNLKCQNNESMPGNETVLDVLKRCAPTNAEESCQHDLDRAIERVTQKEMHMLRFNPFILFHCSEDKLWTLVKKGFDVNTADRYTGWTPLHVVAMIEKSEDRRRSVAEKILILVAAGADPNAIDRRGLTPLHRAAESESVKAARVLIAAGANVNARTKRHRGTPLHLGFQNPEMVKALIAGGADVNAKNDYGETPLDHVYHHIVKNKQHEITEPLIAAGAKESLAGWLKRKLYHLTKRIEASAAARAKEKSASK
jgi:ankyrin repeat protein